MVLKVQPLVSARSLVETFDYSCPPELQEQVTVGSLVVAPFGPRKIRGVVRQITESSNHKLKPIDSLPGERVLPELLELSDWMAEDIVSTPARCLELMLPPKAAKPKQRFWAQLAPHAQVDLEDGAVTVDGVTQGRALTAGQLDAVKRLPAFAESDLPTLRRLEKRGLVQISLKRQLRDVDTQASSGGGEVVLNDDQRFAIRQLTVAEPGSRYLLHGVTGSGKTEVYLQVAAAQLEQGKSVLVLVPEIGLTPQTVKRFSQRFGQTVAVLHSGLDGGRRLDEWTRVLNQEAQICVGPMSAVFAPLQNIGLVIVDEEHDSSFKSDSEPRYDARRIAAWRATHNQAVLLCGSATPRPEAWNSLKRISLPRRADGRDLPEVRLLDMRGVKGVLHPTVYRELASTPKSVVLLNKRGWARWLQCGSCGQIWECDNCDVSLVLHGGSGNATSFSELSGAILRCHHCGFTKRPPQECDGCGSKSVGHHGVGTEQLASMLPGEVFRVDGDVKKPLQVIDEFHRADSGILLGTQMIAKGHDFSDVSLAVIIDADATLRFPDFRADERTFQLVAQLAGRAGRSGESSGHVYVQTLSPSQTSLLHAARHDAIGFLAEELDRREKGGFPPFSSLVRLTVEHQDELETLRAAEHVRSFLPADTYGPYPVFRRQDRFRQRIELRANTRSVGVAAIRNAAARALPALTRRGVILLVEVDPR